MDGFIGLTVFVKWFISHYSMMCISSVLVVTSVWDPARRTTSVGCVGETTPPVESSPVTSIKPILVRFDVV